MDPFVFSQCSFFMQIILKKYSFEGTDKLSNFLNINLRGNEQTSGVSYPSNQIFGVSYLSQQISEGYLTLRKKFPWGNRLICIILCGVYVSVRVPVHVSVRAPVPVPVPGPVPVPDPVPVRVLVLVRVRVPCPVSVKAVQHIGLMAKAKKINEKLDCVIETAESTLRDVINFAE
jgi:hypothetical protein